MDRPKLLVIDNYDSFTYNLVQMFLNYPLSIDVFRSDQITLLEIEKRKPDYILISPGPKTPSHAGISISIIRNLCDRVPILGVCLGMQCINEAFGGITIRSPLPMHGKTSLIRHSNEGIFRGMPSPFRGARYHSLMIKMAEKDCRRDLVVTATSPDNVIMGVSHGRFPLHGVQFHPESFLTENGFRLIENFLNLGPLKRLCLTADPFQ
jgi:anthranilate synthase component 2